MTKIDKDFVGRHLILDFTVRPEKGASIKKAINVYNFLEKLSHTLKMTLIHPPIVARLPFANNELEVFINNLKQENISASTIVEMENHLKKRAAEENGISGIAMWLESHCSVHTWPEQNFVSLDAYSCKDFDVTLALEMINETFSINKGQGLNIKRYLSKPQTVSNVIYGDDNGFITTN